MFYVLNKKKIKVLNFWVPERARVIHHVKKQLYVLNFEYAKPGTLRDNSIVSSLWRVPIGTYSTGEKQSTNLTRGLASEIAIAIVSD